MLVLTRRVDESIVIDDNIIVTVLAVEKDKVKIGIKAPREIGIFRRELWLAINEQNKIAERLASGPEPDTFDSLRQLLIEEAMDEEGGGEEEEESRE